MGSAVPVVSAAVGEGTLGGSSMAVVLFADVVGSTELQANVGDSRYDAIRRGLMGALERVVGDHGGAVVKTMGDGVMATFGSALSALVAADGLVAAAHHERRTSGFHERVELRVGVSAGEVILDGGDVHGTPVVEAARLCAAAAPGQVLCNDVVAMLTRGFADRLDLVPVGELTLKGLPAPVAALELRAVRAPPNALPLPAVLSSTGPFVGRVDEVAALRTAVASAIDGADRARRLVLISGEPGVGKTRLVGEAAIGAHEGGAWVVLGRCVEDLVAPFAPWAEIVTTLGDHMSDEEIAGHGERHGPVLERLAPALRPRLARTPPLDPMEPEVERRRVADAVDDLLSTAAGNRGLVVVLDDLHWADSASIAVLGHVLRSSRPGSFVLFGTYRDTDLDRSHPLAASLADLHRSGAVERHALAGLDHREVRDLVEAFADQEADPGLVDALVAETDGNPFFVSEVLRHLVESGAYRKVDGTWVADRPLEELGLPQGVREVVGRRLSRLDDAANRVLAAAAVVGAEFSYDVVELVLGGVVDADAVAESIAAAQRAGLIREVDRRAGRYAFGHALIRQVLLDELPSPRRARLHWAVGEAIRRRHPRALEQIAFHFVEGVLAGSPEEAVDAAMAAGEEAIERSLGAQAQLYFERALATIDVTELDDVDRRYRVLHGLGRASVLRLDTTGWTSSFVAAAELARSQGWEDRFVESVIAATQLGDVGGVIDQRLESLLTEARPLAGDERQLAGLLCGASAAAYARADFRSAAAHAREALEVARTTGDLDAIARAQWTVCTYRFGLDPPDVVASDLAALESAFDDGRAEPGAGSMSGSPDQVLEGLRCMAALQQGDRREVERYLASAAELPGMNRRFNVPYWSATLASVDGRLDDLMTLADELVDRFPDYAISHVCHLSHVLEVTFEREGWEAATPLADRSSELMGGAAPSFEAFRAAVRARHGELDEAEAAVMRGLAFLADGDGGSNRLLTASGIAEAAFVMRRPEWAEAVLEELRPHLGAMITYSFCWRLFPADLPWGFALLALGEHDRGTEHMERAVAAAEHFEAPALVARCRLGLVQALHARAAPGDEERAAQELDAVAAVATSLGLAATLEQCRALSASRRSR